MKVIMQKWRLIKGGYITSISKNREQLEETIQELAPQPDPEDEDDYLNYNEASEPEGDAEEMDIPDDSIFVDMMRFRTIFLNEDEMDLIWDNLPRDEGD